MSTSRYRSLVVPGILAAVAFAILVSLGVWQVERLQWKEALIARVAAGMDAEPVAAPGPEEWPALDLGEAEYRPVTVSGRYLNDREAHVIFTLTAPKGPAGGLGYMVMTPFETDDGWIVYVNRGFTPRERKDPATRAEGLIEGETTVAGLLREAHMRPWFAPGDNPDANEWISRSPAAFAEAGDLPADTVAPYIIDAFADPALPGGLPQGGETLVSFPNSHLGYAVTWFGLALALLAVFAVFVRRALRR